MVQPNEGNLVFFMEGVSLLTQSLAFVTDPRPSEAELDKERCYVPEGDSVATGICMLRAYDDKVVLVGYAINEATWSDMVKHFVAVGSLQVGLLRTGDTRWYPFANVVANEDGYLRVDDNRPGSNWSYRIWLGEHGKDVVSLMPRTVYHWFGSLGAEHDEHAHARLETYEDVVALTMEPAAVRITQVPLDVANKDLGDDETQRLLSNLDEKLVVWDLGSIWRHFNEQNDS